MTILAEFLGWFGNMFFIWGVYALGKKNIYGFFANSIGNLLYLWQAWIIGNSALCFLSIGLIYLNIKGILEWRKNEKKNCKK